MSVKNNLSSHALDYEYKECCDMHGWIREGKKKVNMQSDLKYICKGCVKFWSWLNEK